MKIGTALSILLLSCSLSASIENTQFYFNQTNINAISVLVCSLHSSLSSESGRADEKLYYHKFNTQSLNPKNLKVVGLCKSQDWNSKNNFKMKSHSLNKLVGNVENYKFYVYFEEIKRIHKGKVKNPFVLSKITMFPSPSVLPDGLAEFLEPSFEKISVQKIIPTLANWHLELNSIEFKSDEFSKSLLGFVMYERKNNLFIDAVPTLNFHT